MALAASQLGWIGETGALHLIGNDGVRYVVEGCAAYPVTAEAKPQQSKAVASTDVPKAKVKLAQSKPVENTN